MGCLGNDKATAAVQFRVQVPGSAGISEQSEVATELSLFVDIWIADGSYLPHFELFVRRFCHAAD